MVFLCLSYGLFNKILFKSPFMSYECGCVQWIVLHELMASITLYGTRAKQKIKLILSSVFSFRTLVIKIQIIIKMG